MSNSNLPPSIPASKSLSNHLPLPSGQSSGISNLLANDRQKRSGSNSASSSTTRNTVPTPRNNQSLRKKNKNSKKPKLFEDMAEAASMRTSSRRGQTNITHLMNFTLPPRPYNHSSHSYAGRGSHAHRRSNHSWGYNTIDKARYIHANYRFIVSPDGDYEHLVSVDDHVEWKDVLQVLVSSRSQNSSCPICLSDPVSPRMAKCGHIFCLPCLIRYMHSTDDSAPIPEKKIRWKKCPICEDSIYISEARPVRWFIGQEADPPRDGGDIVLRLMKRDQDSTLALPRDVADSTTISQTIPWYFNAEVMDYARIMKGNAEYMQSQYDQEIQDIEIQEKEDELMFGEETLWTQKAIASIRDAKEKVKTVGDPPGRSLSTTFLRSAGHGATSDASNQTESSGVEQLLSTLHSLNEVGTPLSHTTFFFYQALLHYYLSPLDIRILRAEFIDFPLFPSAVLAKVEHVSTGHIVDDELRKRAKYLGHLPQGCEVSFLECDWTDIVSPEVLSRFSADLDRRRKRNKDKEIREEKERVRAERAEDDKRFASIRRRRDSSSHQRSSGPAISIPGSSLESNVPDLGTSASPPWNQSRAGFAPLASPSTSPNGRRTVWGTAAIAPSDSPILLPNTMVEPEHDGWLQNWEQDLMREDEVLSQLQAVTLTDGMTTPVQAGKKKKQKKITLMSTNARRAA